MACTSGPKKQEQEVKPIDITAGSFYQWESKAMIKNTKTGEANVLNLDIIAKKPFPFRAEVTNSMGFHLASIVVLEKEIQFLLPKSKKFYTGDLSSKVLRPVLNVSLDPKLIIGAIFNEPFDDWKCESENGTLKSCETQSSDKINWSPSADRNGHRVEIKGESYESQFQIKLLKESPAVKDSTFILKIPEGFKTYTLKN